MKDVIDYLHNKIEIGDTCLIWRLDSFATYKVLDITDYQGGIVRLKNYAGYEIDMWSKDIVDVTAVERNA